MRISSSKLRVFAIIVLVFVAALRYVPNLLAQANIYLPIISGSSATAPTPITPTTYNDLWIPDVITGTTFNLTLSQSRKQFREGEATTTYGYNGAHFWGPTLIMNKGDNVQLNVTNQLSETTTTHWHGFHIPAAMDGGPMQGIAAGTTWSPSFEVKNNAATYWYHPHLHEKTQEQLSYGAGGLIIVRDAQEAALPLPRTYGVDDIPLVLTSRRFLENNQFAVSGDENKYGDYQLSNGTLNAAIALPAQFVRLRILNAEVERGYNLGFSDNRNFYVIATDGGLVNAPIQVNRVKLMVGERVEILVDLTADSIGSTLDLKAYNSGQTFGFPGAEHGGPNDSLLNDIDFNLLHIRVAKQSANPIITLPTKLADNHYWTEADVTNSRTIQITGGGRGSNFSFDNKSYDMMSMNQTVKLNAVEKWTIVNNQIFGHSFHIHDVQFNIISRSSGSIETFEQGWKDTVYVPRGETVSFIAKFSDFASASDPYMFHCHFSNHEDGGMMGQFVVVE